MERFCFVHCLVAYMKPKININEFSHLLGTVLFAKSATVVQSDCIVQSLYINGTGTFFGHLLSFFDGEFLTRHIILLLMYY